VDKFSSAAAEIPAKGYIFKNIAASLPPQTDNGIKLV
jgi:hypothetical protein